MSVELYQFWWMCIYLWNHTIIKIADISIIKITSISITPLCNPSFPPFPSPSQGNTDLLFVTMDLFLFSRVLKKTWNHMICIIFCVWLLSFRVIFLRHSHTICNSNSFLFIAEQFSLVSSYHNLLIHLHVDIYLGCFHFQAIKYKTTIQVLFFV